LENRLKRSARAAEALELLGTVWGASFLFIKVSVSDGISPPSDSTHDERLLASLYPTRRSVKT
jgi:hypothetical protein